MGHLWTPLVHACAVLLFHGPGAPVRQRRKGLASRRVTLRLDGGLAHVIADSVLVRTPPADPACWPRAPIGEARRLGESIKIE
jgi:hypothetical protein